MAPISASHNGRARALIGAYSIFLALPPIFVGFRLWARRLKRSNPCFNDYAIIAALVIYVPILCRSRRIWWVPRSLRRRTMCARSLVRRLYRSWDLNADLPCRQRQGRRRTTHALTENQWAQCVSEGTKRKKQIAFQKSTLISSGHHRWYASVADRKYSCQTFSITLLRQGV